MQLGRTKRMKKGNAAKRVLMGAAIALIAAALGGWALFLALAGAQDIGKLEEPLPAATVIYDQDGKEASRISLSDIEEIKLSEIPASMVNAIVAVEDKRFFEHDGMDLRAISRALFANLASGGTVQGGSTITQQLAKNVFLSHERTWSRKWNEVLLAKKIEDHYSKQEIMELYLNQIYFGEGAWGIKRAAYVYFGKEPKELTVAESALLAGLVKAPSKLTPYKNPEQAKERRGVVLQLMKEQSYIDEAAFREAMAEPIRLLGEKPNRIDDIRYPYYVDAIIREAVSEYGLTENEVLHGGLRIYAALDQAMQQEAERVYADASLFPASSADQLIQSGAALIDPRDGGIRALVGGRGDQPFRGFNRAVQLKRQPGSTMKPIAVYAPALELGYKPTDTIVDEPVSFGGYSPKNAVGAYHGEVTLYEALTESYNVPAVKLLNEIGIAKGVEAAERFGIPLTDGDRTLGLALGGLQEGVSPVRMAEAFGTFANDGVREPAHAIVRIESADGELLGEAKSSSGTPVVAPDIARTMTAMLEGVVKEGTGTPAAINGRPIAGKTGTTEMDGTGGSGAKDNWFVGYTPQLVGAVWLGYDRTDAQHYLTTSSKAAAAVFQALMSGALRNEPVMSFPAAPMPVAGKADKHGDNGDEDEEDREEHGHGQGKKHGVEKWKEELEKWKDRQKDKREDRGKGKDRGEDDDEHDEDGNDEDND